MVLRTMLDDDDDVSPVIGVVLMVAITVILAAVIASFVMGLGPQDNQAPTVSFDTEYDDTEEILTVVFDTGDTVSSENIVFRGDVSDTGDASAPDPDVTSADQSWADAKTSTKLVAGKSVMVGVADPSSGTNEVTIIYESDGTSNILKTVEV